MNGTSDLLKPLPVGDRRSAALPVGDRRSVALPVGKRRSVALPVGKRRSVALRAGDRRSVALPAGDRASVAVPTRGSGSVSDESGARGAASRQRAVQLRVVPTHIERYLPVSLLTTGLVTVVPLALVATFVSSARPLPVILTAIAAMVVSIAIASIGAAVWKRCPGSRDVMFADLMLWNWCHRCWSERRLGQAHTLYESARQAGPSVSVELLKRLSALLEARDAYTQGHSQRVARYAGLIADAMRLPDTERAKIRTAGAVHDVGKVHTPQEILNCPGALTEEQFRILKQHPIDGWEMLADVGEPGIAAMVRHHHERVDGRGYPDGLAGEEIPLGARIIAVADTFDAITSDRAYRCARTHKKALDLLREQAGSQLDGAAVAAFVQAYTARRPVAWLAFASAVSQRLPALLSATSTSVSLSATGTASLLPALGAVGAIALAHPAPHRSDAAVSHPRASIASTQRDHLGASATAIATPPVAGARRHTAAAGRGERHASHTVPARTTPIATTPAGTSAHTPVPSRAPVGESIAFSVAGVQASAPAVSGPGASSEVSGRSSSPGGQGPPANAQPPGGGSQGAGNVPIVAPVSSPTVPAPPAANAQSTVTTPSVTIPSAAVPVQTPAAGVTVTTPSVSLPAVKLP